MKIQCQSCQAKYTIADEKVLGKVVKIRCKKCSATIVINGNELAQGGDPQAFDYAAPGADQWTVNVADGDQRTLTIAEIATEYRNGVINDETYCWKDGMPDWLPLRDIEELYAAVAGGAGQEDMPGVSVPPPHSSGAAQFGAGAGDFGAPAAHASGNGALFAGGGDAGGAAEPVAAAPAAARRAGGRAQGADLFGNVEKAGGEDDVMTSAASAASSGPGLGGASAEAGLTGQRNENSVLFSLAALTQQAEPVDRTTATADGSGLIDIRALSASMDANESKKKDTGARVDDIMNLSGGGAFGAALAAPILAPPPLEAVDMGALGTADAPAKQSKMLMVGILGGCAILGICGVVVAMLMRGPSDEGARADSTTPAPAESVAMATPPVETAAPAAATPAPADDDSPAPPGTGQSTSPAPAAAPAKPAAKAAARPAQPAAEAPKPKPAAASKPTDLSGALAAAAGRKPDPAPARAATSTAPFDRGAAAAALGSVNVQSCKKPGGPTGAGRVTVTFAPTGTVQSAVVDPPYQGTPVGGCVAGKFRAARVPPFGGANVRVGKSFIIN